MPHYNCCVPGCTNSFRNAPDLQFYRIPKDESLRRIYKVILKNETLKLESTNTWICSAHFEDGKKLSRSHLPTIFPWNKPQTFRRELKKKVSFEEAKEHEHSKRQKRLDAKIQQSMNTVESGIETQTLLTGKEIDDLKLQLESLLEENRQLKETNRNIVEQNNKLKAENLIFVETKNNLEQQVIKLKHNLENFRFDIDKYKGSDEDIAFYTGFPDYEAMVLCYKVVESKVNNIVYEGKRASISNVGRPRALTKFQEFVLVLMRLRLGLLEKDLAHRFNVSRSTVSKVTKGWIQFLRKEFEPLIALPPREVINHYMPPIFKSFFPKVAVIVDCTEFEMEKPSSLNSQSACYSSYKSRTTMKALLGIIPSGVLCFVRELFPGSTSDKEITTQSGFLSKLQPGDQVMADKGFNCQDELASVGAAIVMPAFLNKEQFTKEETYHNKVVASLRVHVERLMERIKNWHILNRRIPITLAPIASDMLVVVGAISNFHPPLIS